MALKATEDPILIRERREIMTRLTQRAFSGTVKVGLTCCPQFSQRHGWAACQRTHLCQKVGKRKALVSGKRVDLTGGCGDVTDCRTKLHDHN